MANTGTPSSETVNLQQDLANAEQLLVVGSVHMAQGDASNSTRAFFTGLFVANQLKQRTSTHSSDEMHKRAITLESTFRSLLAKISSENQPLPSNSASQHVTTGEFMANTGTPKTKFEPAATTSTDLDAVTLADIQDFYNKGKTRFDQGNKSGAAGAFGTGVYAVDALLKKLDVNSDEHKQAKALEKQLRAGFNSCVSSGNLTAGAHSSSRKNPAASENKSSSTIHDPDISVPFLVEMANECMRQNDVDGAIKLYKHACETISKLLPTIKEDHARDARLALLHNWYDTLCKLYKRINMDSEAQDASQKSQHFHGLMKNKNLINFLFPADNSSLEPAPEEKMTLFSFLRREIVPLINNNNREIFVAAAKFKNSPQTPGQHYARGKCYFNLTRFFNEEGFFSLDFHFFAALTRKDWEQIPRWQHVSRIKLNAIQMEEVQQFLSLKHVINPDTSPKPSKQLEQQVRSCIQKAKAMEAETNIDQCITHFEDAYKLLESNHKTTALNSELYYEFALLCLKQNRTLAAFEALCVAIISYPKHAKSLHQRAKIYFNFAQEFAQIECTHLKEVAQQRFLEDATTALAVPHVNSSESLTNGERSELKKMIDSLKPSNNKGKDKSASTANLASSSTASSASTDKVDEKSADKTTDVTNGSVPDASSTKAKSSSVSAGAVTDPNKAPKPDAKADTATSSQSAPASPQTPSDEPATAPSSNAASRKKAAKKALKEQQQKAEKAKLEQQLMSEINSWRPQIAAAKTKGFDAALQLIDRVFTHLTALEQRTNIDLQNLQNLQVEFRDERVRINRERVKIYCMRAKAANSLDAAIGFYQQALQLATPELKLEINNNIKSKYQDCVAVADTNLKQLTENADSTPIKTLYQQAQKIINLVTEAKMEHDHVQQQLTALQQRDHRIKYNQIKTIAATAYQRALQDRQFNPAKTAFTNLKELTATLAEADAKNENATIDAQLSTIDDHVKFDDLMARAERAYQGGLKNGNFTLALELYPQAEAICVKVPELEHRKAGITTRVAEIDKHVFDKLLADAHKTLQQGFKTQQFGPAQSAFQKAAEHGKKVPDAKAQHDEIQTTLQILAAGPLTTAPAILKEMSRLANETKDNIDSKLCETLSQRMLTIASLTHKDFAQDKESSELIHKLLSSERGFEIFIRLPAVRQRVLPELPAVLEEKLQTQMLALPRKDYYQVAAILLAITPCTDVTYPQQAKNVAFAKLGATATAKLLESWDPQAKVSMDYLTNTAAAFNACIDPLYRLIAPEKFVSAAAKTKSTWKPNANAATFSPSGVSNSSAPAQSQHEALSGQAAHFNAPVAMLQPTNAGATLQQQTLTQNSNAVGDNPALQDRRTLQYTS